MAELAEIRDNVRKIVKALDLDDFFDREGEITRKPAAVEKTKVSGEEQDNDLASFLRLVELLDTFHQIKELPKK